MLQFRDTEVFRTLKNGHLMEGGRFKGGRLIEVLLYTLFYKNIVCLAQAEHYYFSANLGWKYSYDILRLRIYHVPFYSLVYVFCAAYLTFVKHVPFIEMA